MIIRDHGAALDHDLICNTPYCTADIPGNMGWSQVAHFVEYLKPGSALYDELHPETAGWSHTDVMLADVFDAVAALHHAFVAANSKKRPKRPKPYPRPWAKHKETKHYGKDPIPLSEFNSWWESSS